MGLEGDLQCTFLISQSENQWLLSSSSVFGIRKQTYFDTVQRKAVTDFQDLAPTAARCNLLFPLGQKEKSVLPQLTKWVHWIPMTEHFGSLFLF